MQTDNGSEFGSHFHWRLVMLYVATYPAAVCGSVVLAMEVV